MLLHPKSTFTQGKRSPVFSWNVCRYIFAEQLDLSSTARTSFYQFSIRIKSIQSSVLLKITFFVFLYFREAVQGRKCRENKLCNKNKRPQAFNYTIFYFSRVWKLFLQSKFAITFSAFHHYKICNWYINFKTST